MTSLDTSTTNFTQENNDVLVETYSKVSSNIINSTITFSDDDSACSFDSEEEEKLLTPPIQSSSSCTNPEEEEPVINTIKDDTDWGKI